jgi:hypothetical protein
MQILKLTGSFQFNVWKGDLDSTKGKKRDRSADIK